MAVVRNIQNNDLYVYEGNDVYRNMRTQVRGNVPPEVAEKIFKINVEVTGMWSKYPLIEDLIHKLNLKIEK